MMDDGSFGYFGDEDIRPRYRLCRAGFALIALALALLCVAKISLLAMLFGARREMQVLHDHPAWFWLVDAPITWGSLLGSYLLWGRWSEPSWQRKAGLLVLMNGLDAVMWSIDHAERFGLQVTNLDLGWTFFVVANALGWFELILASSLASSVAFHLGARESAEAGNASYTIGLIGAIVWGVLMITQTNWQTWPPGPDPSAEFLILLLVSTVLAILLTFQVTVQSLTASRLCAAHLRTLSALESGDDLLRSRSETDGEKLLSDTWDRFD